MFRTRFTRSLSFRFYAPFAHRIYSAGRALVVWLALIGIGITTHSAQATVPWTPLVICDGPSGQAVLDDFVYTAYGQPVFQQQFVVRNEVINRWFFEQGMVAREIAQNYPQELIIPLMRLGPEDLNVLPETLQTTLGAFHYVLRVQLPEVTLRVLFRKTGREHAHWVFRECVQVR